MKRLHLFAYCDSVISPAVVWYFVRVGQSIRDRRAHNALLAMAKDSSAILYSQHTQETATFLEKVATSLFPRYQTDRGLCASALRRRLVDVVTLARFVRTAPICLLNTDKTYFETLCPNRK